MNTGPILNRVPLLQHGVRIHGGMDRRVLAVLLHEDLGGAVDVEVRDLDGVAVWKRILRAVEELQRAELEPGTQIH